MLHNVGVVDATLLVRFLWHHNRSCSSVLQLMVLALRPDVSRLPNVVTNYPLLLRLPCSLIRALLIPLRSGLIARPLAFVGHDFHHLLAFLGVTYLQSAF